jgi:hypothetical protein
MGVRARGLDIAINAKRQVETQGRLSSFETAHWDGLEPNNVAAGG